MSHLQEITSHGIVQVHVDVQIQVQVDEPVIRHENEFRDRN